MRQQACNKEFEIKDEIINKGYKLTLHDELFKNCDDICSPHCYITDIKHTTKVLIFVFFLTDQTVQPGNFTFYTTLDVTSKYFVYFFLYI